MRFIHQLAELSHIICFQSLNGFQRAVVFEYRMTGTLTFQWFGNSAGQLIELLIRKLAQGIQLRLYFLEFI